MPRIKVFILVGLVLALISLAICLSSTQTGFASSESITERISISTNGEQANANSSDPSISADGRFVAFQSSATNLVVDDSNEVIDIFVHDREFGQTSRVSVSSTGQEGNADSYSPAISADGRYIAFISSASNLVEADTNGVSDIFVHDRFTGRTTRISVSSEGEQANDSSGAYGANSILGVPSLSGDGRFIAFHSNASNLIDNDTNGGGDIFVRDQQLSTTSVVSISSSGELGQGHFGADSRHPSISSDGRYVSFQSWDTNLVDNIVSFGQIYVHDRVTGITKLISASPNGEPANSNNTYCPSISANGHWVVFESIADNLIPGDSTWSADAFVYDMQASTVSYASLASDESHYDVHSFCPSVSGDGRFVTFYSLYPFVSEDNNQEEDIYLRDQLLGTTSLASPTYDHSLGNGASHNGVVSANGRLVAFVSTASNLVESDTNEFDDIFLFDRCPDGTCTNIYTIMGKVTDANGQPLQGVTITANGIVTTTGDDGSYALTAPAGETYTLSPDKTGYLFTPTELTLTLNQNRNNQNFIARVFSCGDGNRNSMAALMCQVQPAKQPFLNLPVPYEGDSATFLTDTDNGVGYINSWFDHDQPTYRGNNGITLFNGSVYQVRSIVGNPNLNLWCYKKEGMQGNGPCYDGHDGLDIVQGSSHAVISAASGVVLETCHRDGRPSEPCQRAASLGRYIVISHLDGTYATLYAHLASIADWVVPGVELVRNDISTPNPIGMMGNSGDPTGKMGIHLHFQVYFNRSGVSNWIPKDAMWNASTGKMDGEVVDPMGWQPGDNRTDAWQAVPSVPLFKRTNPLSCIPGEIGETLSSPAVSVQIPPNAASAEQSVWLAPLPGLIDLTNNLRSVGRSFYLRIVDPDAVGFQVNSVENNEFAKPVNINIAYPIIDTPHLDLQKAELYWNNPVSGWEIIESTRDETDHVFKAQTEHSGDFALMAPLVCRTDISEPMDDRPSSKMILQGIKMDLTLDRWFDISQDEDWVVFNAIAGIKYTFHTKNLSPSVDTLLTLYGTDEQTILAEDDNSGGGKASQIIWIAPASGLYYLRVTQGLISQAGCDSMYQLHMESAGSTVYLPIIVDR